MQRLRACLAGLVSVLLALAAPVLAQEFPLRTVRIVVPYPAGGGVDGLARALAERLSRLWGQAVVIDNRAPAATPRGVVDRIRRDIAAILADPEFRDKEITSRSNSAVGSAPEEFAAFIRADPDYKGKLIRVSGAKAE